MLCPLPFSWRYLTLEQKYSSRLEDRVTLFASWLCENAAVNREPESRQGYFLRGRWEQGVSSRTLKEWPLPWCRYREACLLSPCPRVYYCAARATLPAKSLTIYPLLKNWVVLSLSWNSWFAFLHKWSAPCPWDRVCHFLSIWVFPPPKIDK